MPTIQTAAIGMVTGAFRVGKPDFALDDLSIRPDAVFKVVKGFAARADAEAFVRAPPRRSGCRGVCRSQ